MSSSTPSPSARSDTLCTTGKRVRTSKPKVRSGCVTCKARRIKCDEIHPSCDRCTKFGRECGGYKVQLTYEERVAARNGRSRILPKVYQASTSTSPPPLLQLLPSLSPLPPSINVPLTPQQVFCIEASLELCRILEFPQWTSIKVEICKHNPYIGHAFSAIRMLSKGPPPTPDYIDPQLQSHSHDPNLYALHQERFLEGSRLALSSGPATNQPLLASIICLLTITLETLQFHHDPALSHIQFGLTLISQLPSPEPQLSSQSQIPSTSPFFNKEIIHAFRMLEAKANLLDNCFSFYTPMPLGFRSPFVIPQLFSREEMGFEQFVGFGDETQVVVGDGFQSRGSSVANIGTP